MRSFRTEIENPVVEKDIIELADKIAQYNNLQIDEEKFRSLRLARGVYGQRQQGVQMIRIKLPYGKVKSNQLRRIAAVSDEYSTGKLHITTRQDIQIHYVDLNRTPELWAELEKDDVTLREACGNTVRNVTASETAGIDINEPFDVSPYAEAVFRFFLRNPFCQEMGRKFKVSFSASNEDSGLSYMHDLGFIAKIENEVRGFKVLIAGGLGSQPRHADVLYEFVPSDKMIPMMEGVLRIFDRYGERKSRVKARLKFLINDIGLEDFKDLVAAEQNAIEFKSVEIDVENYEIAKPVQILQIPEVTISDKKQFEIWKKTNVIPQKQKGFVAIGVKVLLGNFYTDTARKLADLVEKYAASEIRFSLRQNLIIPFVKEELLEFFYSELTKLNFAEPGYNKAVDITACPGTDTCNLGIASSTGIAKKLEDVIKTEYPQLLANEDLVIKISGCMNACGQHNMAHIGFQGMSVRTPEKLVAPALQVLLGGGNLGNGKGVFADKVVKIPSKRGPEALRRILNDFEKNGIGINFTDYYAAKGKKYFYDFLSDLQDATNLTQDDFIDWGNSETYVQEIGIGECAGVVIDLIATLFLESEEKIEKAKESHQNEVYSNAIYHAYSSLVNSAKAMLLSEDISTNSHANIIQQFDEVFISSDKISLETTFSKLIYQIQEQKPTAIFSEKYIQDANYFLQKLREYRKLETSFLKENQ
ncbi:MAG: nitrite reductase [Flavobacteriaceae bacterium CG_4_10_14_3_um_filter_31_253]|nr:MAG: nitrite reductase [Flavobacteriaceae bacterium CG17_big_fil_post_rev_8_21_14_2_50_31_13]PIX11119.1 MAG: nitrite reductase [Flavobacteriaceae bacterium CG_4_8_14_3_um_filter_31_8]PIY13678.1 MAG: nitrite reductase [Flavobacteriaceae bacterium CG_4_10_14_3_um_filter_31_253]PIZ10522.1 MAG: nitrite reductase [Flavobacteriaceae bacterium CG_4_10_14_0_8_um_filter_31_99]PJC10471.1 MAG: nitrite reductase [Flavobacteriaceae bacterium CG_4_9_14_0_8_um_filter_31_91]